MICYTPLVLIFILALVAPAIITAGEYHVAKGDENKVVFYSDAPLEDIEGVTSNIDGFVYFPGDKLLADGDYSGSEFHFEVKLTTIDTGIGLRNRHMRESYLETDQFPYASYAGVIDSVANAGNDAFLVYSSGKFKVHGIVNDLILKIEAHEGEGGFLVSTDFELNLNDYEIEVPKLMFMKVSEIVEVKLELKLILAE